MRPSDVKRDVRAATGPVGRQEVVAAILKAARDLIAERGPSGVSLREISKHAGVNHGLVYMYIGTKDQLIAEVFRHVDNLTEALDLLLHAGDGSDTRLMAWAALDSSEPASLFAPTASLEALARIFRRDAADGGTDMPLREARIAAALAAMVATAWRVFSPVARLTAGVTSHDTAAFDEATSRLLSSLGHGSAGPGTVPPPA
jgi:TetR/AcrR family transcriptional regulator, repressor for neighboring sulfatase